MKLSAVKTPEKARAFKGLASRRESNHGAPVASVETKIAALTAVKSTKKAWRINALTDRGC
jgi:hypothetical protein